MNDVLTTRDHVQNSFKLKMQRNTSHLWQDIGILFFMAAMFCSCITIGMAPSWLLTMEVILFAFMCFGILLAAYNFRYLAVAEAGAQVLIYTVYVIYQHHINLVDYHWTHFVWLFLPPASIGSMLLYQANIYRTELLNETLSKQMDDLVLIHPLTGLYNTRALYIDLERQISYAKRNKLELSLICVELRYASELKHAMSQYQFDQLCQALAQCVEDTLRLEDRIYSTGEDNGALTAILTCGAAGAAVVKHRILDAVNRSTLFDQIVNQSLRVDLRIAFLEYDPETIPDAIAFKHKVDNEMQYDV